LLDAPVPLFWRAVGGQILWEGGLDGDEQVVLVAFDLEAVVPAFFDDGLRGVGNGMQAVGGDGLAVERLKREQQPAGAV